VSLETTPAAPALLEKILDKISTGRMPPPGAPAPAKAELDAAIAALNKTLGHSNSAVQSPGRVTARRLNRIEYDNTLHDLLGISLRPGTDFPLDDAGYGFDNNGDVLSISPLLMEKYTTAARAASRAAVYGEVAPKQPGKLTRFLGKKLQDDPTSNALPFSLRGALWTSYDFPVTGDYEFRMRIGNYRPRENVSPRQKELSRKFAPSPAEKAELAELNRIADPPVKMVMTVDGREIYSEVVEGNIDYAYAHGESIARTRLTAGEHRFRASFPEYADMDDPRTNVNTDGRRKIFVDYIDIVGPFNPAPAPKNPAIFVCPEHTPACARRIIENTATRAWRRPVTVAELDRLAKLAATVRKDSEKFDEGLRIALEAILLSPNFLFRIEREPTAPATGTYNLNDFELATRLSYFLWSSLPDEPLMRAAREHKLTQPGGLQTQLKRMLTDPRATALIDNFAGQWLSLRELDRRKPDPVRFPLADDEILEAMKTESLLFAGAILRENRPILDFLDGRFTYLNGALARYYGLPGVNGEAFRKVELDGVQRGGVMTHGAILTLSSYATRTSPVLRGKWVLENLLGTPPPPPPPDIPALEEKDLGSTASVRQRLEQHRANPACAVCHNQMDPIGFGLENYDAAGRWRTHDGKFAVDSSGKLPGGQTFDKPQDLRRIMRDTPEAFTRNFVEKMMTYALGRGLEPSDRQAVGAIQQRLAANGYRFATLLEAILESPAFRQRQKI
jgi:Protein of unknown function (DUF1592)/Protein of unknown function (DUF1588)/Protein of unknown function (DUF1587)/Protein of unknown function (DUF1585)/Protein of unknown function (DUF1595)